MISTCSCWCPPGLSPPPPTPQRMDGGGGGGSSHGLAGLPLMRSAGQPRRGPRRQPRASGRRRDWGGQRTTRAGLPPGAGVPPPRRGARRGRRATHALRARTSSRRARRSLMGWEAGGHHLRFLRALSSVRRPGLGMHGREEGKSDGP